MARAGQDANAPLLCGPPGRLTSPPRCVQPNLLLKSRLVGQPIKDCWRCVATTKRAASSAVGSRCLPAAYGAPPPLCHRHPAARNRRSFPIAANDNTIDPQRITLNPRTSLVEVEGGWLKKRNILWTCKVRVGGPKALVRCSVGNMTCAPVQSAAAAAGDTSVTGPTAGLLTTGKSNSFHMP